ncbi:MAG: VanW family protein, partial [Clostridia bacterium]|nr:VanW family protein [Clostridia bacterium]
MIKLCGSALSLLLAGSFFFGGLGTGRVRSGVTIEGVAVGGMTYAAAETAVREKLTAAAIPFTVKTPDGTYTPEITVKDDLRELLRKAKKGETLCVRTERVWATAEGEISALCAKYTREAVNAELSFSAAGFSYTPEKSGVYCDYRESLRSALNCLESGGQAELSVRGYSPEVTEETLRARTRLLASYTTYFNGENFARSENIRLAASRISGSVIEAGGQFSFNEVVGKRTKENGFRDAAVILDGELVPGVGGGVCQASTTLMNAALRAGMKITESRSHSLSVG